MGKRDDIDAVIDAARDDLAAIEDLLEPVHALLYEPEPFHARDPRCTCQEGKDNLDCGQHGITTVGHAHWVGPTRAQVRWVSAIRHIARANREIGRIDTVPAHWVTSYLDLPASSIQPPRLDVFAHGVRLLDAALSYVDTDALEAALARTKKNEDPPSQVTALRDCRGNVHAALEDLRNAQDKLDPREVKAIKSRRCRVPRCWVKHHAEGFCQEHYNAYRRGRLSA